MEDFLDLPDRSLHRAVKEKELYGTWEITAKSRESLENQLTDDFWVDMALPLLSFNLEPDGKFISTWRNGYGSILFNTSQVLPETIEGTWELNSPEERGSITLHLKNPLDKNAGYTTGLILFERDNELILWTYIQDPDQLIYQDYIKTERK